MIKLLPPGLHILLGDNAGGIFTRVFFARDRLLIDQDVLSCGPTPPLVDLTTWNRLRLDYWTSFVPGQAGEHVHSRFNLVDNAQRLADAERVHIWAATGVSEQLFIAFVVQLMKLVGGDVEKLALVPFEKAEGKRVVGLGELDEAQFREAPDPQPMTVDVIQEYLNAWEALTSSDPEVLVGFARDHPEANRWLKLAIRLMSRRFPDKRTGLTYWDHALLSRVEKFGPGASTIIGYTMAETFEFGDLVGDWYLFGRLMRLGSESNPQPLIELSGDRQSIRNTEVALTPFGKDVLKGGASNYPANPIEDWAAGVKLSSAERRLWFNDGGRLVRG
ncbi:MAG TPA: DUF1835 domain-containing protein [Steroidobacteraceae bacterium]|nr:DUF1835 domain-containing protein [Steroidobacteraceae bacterium]